MFYRVRHRGTRTGIAWGVFDRAYHEQLFEGEEGEALERCKQWNEEDGSYGG